MDHATSDGIRLHVETHGEDANPTVVLAHGLAASTAMWGGVIPELVRHGLRVVAFDMRGHGRSDAPRGEEHYGDQRMAADLIEVVDGFVGPEAVAVGYSMGAGITLVALEAGLSVRGAVVGAAPPAVLRWTETDEQRRAAAVAALRQGPGASADMAAWASSLGPGRFAMADLLAGHKPVVQHWERIRVPVVVLAGDRDALAAPAEEIAARLPLARAVPLAGDHFTAFASRTFLDAIVEAAA